MAKLRCAPPSIDRPAIASVLPVRQRPVVMLDLGANVDCSAENLLQFAVMGKCMHGSAGYRKTENCPAQCRNRRGQGGQCGA
ncbi:MAG: hypothetical protein R3D03_15640 [Geminicoccaceae bacterium]